MTTHRNAMFPGQRDESHNWCANYADVVEFGAYLTWHLSSITSLTSLQDYYQAPWKWTAERNALLAYRAAGLPDPDLDVLEAIAHPVSHPESETLSEMRAAEPCGPDYREDTEDAKETYDADR